MKKAHLDRTLPIGKRGLFRRSEAGAAHPALPAVVLLVCFAFFMAAIAPLDFTAIFHKFFPAQAQKVPHKDATVWVDDSAGVYYCADSIMFGKSRGEYMQQVNALERGYQPALGKYCKGPAWRVPSRPRSASTPSPAPAVSPASNSSSPAPAGQPNTFENPNYKPQKAGTPPVGDLPGQT